MKAQVGLSWPSRSAAPNQTASGKDVDHPHDNVLAGDWLMSPHSFLPPGPITNFDRQLDLMEDISNCLALILEVRQSRTG